MKDDIENFREKTPAVERVARNHVVAWVGDARPAAGSTLWIDTTPTRISRVLEDHRVEAIVFDETSVQAGDPVRHSPVNAQWPRPRPGRTQISDLAFEPEGEVETRVEPEVRGVTPTRIATGLDAIDEWTPLVKHGTNVVLDVAGNAEYFDALVRRAVEGPIVAATNVPHELELAYEIAWSSSHEAALAQQAAVQWARSVDDEQACLVLDAGVDVDLDAVVDAAWGVTIFVRVAVDRDLHVLAETLDLGTSDAQLVLRADGTIDFARSTSRLADGSHAHVFSRVAELKERLALFGDDELEPEDFELLERAELAERILIR